MESYNICLLIQLANKINIIPKEIEYDLQWDAGVKLHQKFVNSNFNDKTQPSYECIMKFLKNLEICPRKHKFDDKTLAIIEAIENSTGEQLGMAFDQLDRGHLNYLLRYYRDYIKKNLSLLDDF